MKLDSQLAEKEGVNHNDSFFLLYLNSIFSTSNRLKIAQKVSEKYRNIALAIALEDDHFLTEEERGFIVYESSSG